MSGKLEVLVPTAEAPMGSGTLSPRLDRLAGATIGVLWNGRQGGDKVICRVLEILKEERGVEGLVFRAKPYLGNVAPDQIFDELSKCDAVVTGVGD